MNLGNQYHITIQFSYYNVSFFKISQYSSTTPDDLWIAIQSALDVSDVPNSHYRIKEVMDTWINQNGYPEVDVRWIYNEDNNAISLSQKCIYKQKSNECFNNTCINNTCTNKWWIPITFATRSNPNFSSTVPTIFLRPDEIISYYIPNPEDWIIVNIQQIGKYASMNLFFIFCFIVTKVLHHSTLHISFNNLFIKA